MPRIQVYLSDDLYQEVKTRRLPASELLQGAVRAELRRQELMAVTEAYLTELVADVGPPSIAEVEWAAEIARRAATPDAAQAS